MLLIHNNLPFSTLYFGNIPKADIRNFLLNDLYSKCIFIQWHYTYTVQMQK